MVRVSGSASLGAVCGAALIACAAGPSGPRGPLHATPGVEVGPDFSVALSQATATMRNGDVVTDTSDHYWSAFSILPRRLELRLALAPWMDVGTDVGWVDGGVDLRLGLPAMPQRDWAMNIALGVRTGEAGMVGVPLRSSYWGRVEAYPLVNGTRGRLVLALGVDAGDFHHQVNYVEVEYPHGIGPPGFGIERHEVRLEASVGYHQAARNGSVLATLSPYAVLDAGDARCSNTCGLVAYQQSFGVLLVLHVSLFLPFKPPRTALVADDD